MNIAASQSLIMLKVGTWAYLPLRQSAPTPTVFLIEVCARA